VKKGSIWLITCCPLSHTPWPYLYNSPLISLQPFKPTPISLQLDLWLIWTLSHVLYLFELLTWSYPNSNSTWSPPQLSFQLNRISHPWTLLGSDLAYPGLDSFLLELKVLIPFWTRTPSQSRLASSIFFLSSPGQLTQVTFTLSAYPIFRDRLTRISPEQLTWTSPEHLTWSHQCLPGLIHSYPAELPYLIVLPIRLLLIQPYTVLPGRITLPDLFLIGLLLIWSYPATLPYFLTQPGNTSQQLDYLSGLTQSPYPAGYHSTGLTRKLPHRPPTLT
jgi:hypothetical protein